MAQCMYLDSRGRRCELEAKDGQAFCPAHGEQLAAGLERGPDLRRWAYRAAALLLLGIFLLPLAIQGYRILKALLN